MNSQLTPITTTTINIQNTSLGVLSLLSFYAPLIITMSIFMSSIFMGVLGKGLYFLFWILIISFIRIFILYNLNAESFTYQIPEQCNVGNILPFHITYSTFILCFTFAYLILPSYILHRQTNMDKTNYILMMFLLSYIIFDIFVKKSVGCININSIGKIIGEIISGLGIGALIAFFTFISPIRDNLFIYSDKSTYTEISSVPTKQRFKCKVYKNGELVKE
jgi:hypothetical protein